MIQGDENVLRIAVIDEAGYDSDLIKEFEKRFDLIIKGESLYPVIKILELL